LVSTTAFLTKVSVPLAARHLRPIESSSCERCHERRPAIAAVSEGQQRKEAARSDGADGIAERVLE